MTRALLAAYLAGTLCAASAPPRISPVPESAFTDAQRQIVATYGQNGAPNDLRTYLNHPVLARNIMPFERYIATDSTLPSRHRELLILRTAWLCRSEYVWAHHVPAARTAGITADELSRIAGGRHDAASWEPFEAALLRAADELHISAFVSDATWAAIAARYDTRQMIDAVFTVAEFTMVSDVVNSVRVQVEDAFKDRLPGIPSRATVARSDERLIGKTPRIAPLEPSEWTAEVRQWLDRSGSGRPVAGVYRTYARHLAMDRPRTLVSEHIRETSTLPPRTRELLIMRIGLLCRSEYEWAAHAPAGRRTGMTEADVLRIVVGPEEPGDPLDGALLQAVDEIYRDDVVSDETWKALSATFNSKQLLDILVTTGGYRMVSMALNSFGVQLEPGAERFPTLPAR